MPVTINDIVNTTMNYLGDYGIETRIRKQCTDLRKQGWKNEDIQDAVIYWFGLKKGDPSMSKGGIGILEYIRGEYFTYKRRQYNFKNKNKDVVYQPKAEKITVRQKPLTKPLNWNDLD